MTAPGLLSSARPISHRVRPRQRQERGTEHPAQAAGGEDENPHTIDTAEPWLAFRVVRDRAATKTLSRPKRVAKCP